MTRKKSTDVIVRVEEVKKSFPLPGAEGRTLDVLNGVTLEIGKGQIVAVVGASGAGKSTLLHIIGTLDKPTAGKVFYDGEDVFSLSDEKLARFRNRNVGFVFQFHHLLPEFTARENAAMPALIKGMAREQALQRATEELNRVGLRDRLDHKPPELSGGEQQRVAVARALMNSPVVVLADEPTGNLDSANASAIHEMIIGLSKDLSQTFVVVTHNEKIAKEADKVVRLLDGRVAGKSDAVTH